MVAGPSPGDCGLRVWLCPQNLPVQLPSPSLRVGGSGLAGPVGVGTGGHPSEGGIREFSRRKYLPTSQGQLQSGTNGALAMRQPGGHLLGDASLTQPSHWAPPGLPGPHDVPVPIAQGRLPHPGLLRPFFISSFPAAKMSVPETVPSWPELHSPEESEKAQTPVRGAQRASKGDAPSTHHEDTRPGLGTLRRAFSRASWRALGQAPGEDPSLLQRSSRFLLRPFRRSLDGGPAAAPRGGHSPEGPSDITDGGSALSTTRVGPEEPEQEEGESFTKNTEHGRKQGREGAAEPRLPGSFPKHPCTELHFTFSQPFKQGSIPWAAQRGQSERSEAQRG